MLNLTPCRFALAAFGLCLAMPALAETLANEGTRPDIDLYAHMSGNCRKLKVAGRDFACKVVAYFHSERGRANFTVALDDPADESHVISFSGEYDHRTEENLYVLAVDQMELKSKDRPKIDGLPVPSVERSDGVCRQAILPRDWSPALPVRQPIGTAGAMSCSSSPTGRQSPCTASASRHRPFAWTRIADRLAASSFAIVVPALRARQAAACQRVVMEQTVGPGPAP